jgi:hypothetical protein
MRKILEIIPIGLALVFGMALLCNAAHAAQVMEECTSESTGLKYVEIEGSGLASIFFFIPLVALAPLAGATDTTGQYRCHVAVIGSDAVGAVNKVKNRHKVTPY